MRKGSGSARGRLIEAAVHEIRTRGYAGTSVEHLCQAAGVTKGAFFHHFDSKEALARAAVAWFQGRADELFATAPYAALSDPVERVLGYVDLRIELIAGELPAFTCLLGTIVQEAYETHPELAAFCGSNMWGQMQGIATDIEAALASRGLATQWDAMSLSQHIQSVIQGAFVLAKARQDPKVAIECLRHLRRYVEMIFKGGEDDGRTGQKAD
ncbi:MAG TPA: TetR/AcrR family transcriptional regulator [Devosia sp.]